MAVILYEKKSTGDKPYCYYTLDNTVQETRQINQIELGFKITSHLADSTSSLGTGANYGLNAYITLNGTEFGPVVLKATDKSWSGNASRNAYARFVVTGLNPTDTTVTASFRVSRTGSAAGDYSKGAALSPTVCSNITIPQGAAPSNITGGTTGTLGTAHNISISSYSDTFTHTLQATFGNTTTTIASNVTTSNLTKAISWTPSYDYAQYNTTGTKLYGTLTLTTNYGNGQSGVSTASAELTIPNNATTQPGISITTSDANNLLATYGKYVQSKSTLNIASTFTPYKGSTASSYYYELRTNNSSGTIIATGSGSSWGWIPTYVGTVYISARVTDSRGFSKTTSATIYTAAYAQPNISKFNCERDDTTSSTINCYIEASSTNVNSANQNATTYKLYYKKSTQSTYTEVTLGTGYSLNYSTTPYKITSADTAVSYDIYVTAKDSLTTTATRKDASVPTAFTLMNFNASGKAMAIGKVSEATGNEELFEVGMNTEIDGDLSVSGNTNVGNKTTSTGEVIAGLTNSYGQLRAVQGNYGFFIRNDGDSTYFMLTNSGDPYGSWNGLRPIMINDGNGYVTLGNGAGISGGEFTINDNQLVITRSETWFSLAPQNSSYCHYQTGATIGHWFNKPVCVQGDVYAGSNYNRKLAYADSVPRVSKLNWGSSMVFSLSDGQQALVMLNHDQMALLWSVSGGTQIAKTNILGSGIQATISNSIVTVTISGGGNFAGFAILSP